MERRIIIILCSFLLKYFPAHCQQVLAINALFTEQNALFISNAESTWLDDGDDEKPMTIIKKGDNFYWLQDGKKTSTSIYEAIFVSIGNAIILDLVPRLNDTLGNKDYRDQMQPLHSFYKIKIEDDTLWMAPLNYAWFYQELAKKNIALDHTWVGGGLLITESTHDLRKFIEEHINAPSFVSPAFQFIRQKRAPTEHQKPTLQSLSNNSTINFQQRCLPAFPIKDGWLGADGDVSLPVSQTQSLFIFSDTYVGRENDIRESKGYTMVSSTVGIATCTAGKDYHIQYYWRNMHSDHPEPIFKSFTSRYSYWPTDAFLHKSSLYVFMQKVGPKIGVAPDEFFKFSQTGFSFAKIDYPMKRTPDQWEPELIPLSFLTSFFTDVHATVKNGNYVFFFAEKKHNLTALLRLKMDFIDSPLKHIEYYSRDHSWKPGIDSLDMAVILPESPGYSIQYHDDIKKWIMVCGPGFMDNRIRLRTSASLTGPWSESVVVYKCPEITPGSPEYDNNNQVYLGRELIQHYDKASRTISITYDINNSDFEKIKSNAKIYIPKIITVSLRKFGIR